MGGDAMPWDGWEITWDPWSLLADIYPGDLVGIDNGTNRGGGCGTCDE
jgi:hypothetical protein